MSIDYKKCFDLIPQAVVLLVAAELGMAPAVCRALGVMYRQLRRSFKIAGCLGLWWRATNGILQGCPLSVILVNVLMGIWKEEIDSLRQQVCVWTRELPPARRLLPAADPEDPPQVVLQDAGRGYVALGAQGYADDTEAVAPGMGALRQTTPATERWLRLTGQSVNVDKSTSFLEGEDDPAPLLLLGEAIPRSQEIKRLGVGIRVGHRRGAGATLEGRMNSIGEVLLRTPHLPTFERRATAVAVKALPKALHGVALADVETGRLRRQETRVVAAMRGPTRTARAKEVVFCLLTPGHRTSPIMCARYERLV